MKKVLLVEDDTVLRESTAELLELSNYLVFTAPNGSAGVRLAMEQKPDVVVCDIMMPEMDGYAVLKALSGNEETRGIPFIFLSAKTERSDVRKGMELGADDYLTKPFEEAELIGAIESRIAKMAILRDMDEEAASEEAAEEVVSNLNELKNFIYDNGMDFEFSLGDAIYREGDNSNTVYLVLTGVVKTHKLDEQGKELITGIHRPDDFFGLTNFTRNIPYPEFATAMEDTRCVGINKTALKEVLQNNPELVLELMQLMSESLTEAREQLLQMAYGSVRKKTANTLLRFADKLQSNVKGPIHILRSDLAGVAGMATETLIRTLSSFKKEGLIDICDRDIRILDVEGLRNMS
ncbi:response regulator [Lentiprolixibacter aurantiacus]|uniref:Response regulator n=1 Tax=Lentiprolixibacter aurantiacus TaxID=2993939 RepID=A0AAE3MMJ5_9FLAO|nr:response regulator [Lentiprolixibacter aurantiacus]MCX2720111.1 response regulator [Lentiprolixibacter aurantiacus]